MTRAREEHGFTIIPVILVLLIGMLLASAAIVGAVSTESGVRGDESSKRALQAARAGLQQTTYQLTALSQGLMSSTGASLCPQQGAAGDFTFAAATLTYGGLRWCAPLDMTLGARERASASISDDRDQAHHMTDKRDVVVVGAADGRTRRVKTTWTSFDLRELFRDYTVFSDGDLSLRNQADVGSPTISGNAGSNATIHLESPGNVIYGNATPGPTGTVDSRGTVLGSTAPASSRLDLPPVDVSQAATNDDGSICAGGCPAGVSFRNLDLSLSGDDVVLTGNTFLLCSLAMSGSGNPTVTFQPTSSTQPVRVFIKDQSQCTPPRPTNVLEIGQKPLVRVLSAAYPVVQVFIASGATRTRVSIENNNPTLPLMLYAPGSDVSVANNGAINGGIAAGTLAISNSTDVTTPSTGVELELGTQRKITIGDFVECAPSAPAGQTLTAAC